MNDKKSILTNAPAILAASAGLITALVGLMAFMSTPAPTIEGFDANPNIISLGESSILKWTVTGKEVSVEIEPGIGIVALSGSREVTPANTTNYTITARSKDIIKTATVQLIVQEKRSAKPNESAENVSAQSTPASITPASNAPASGAPAPNVIVVTVPATNAPASDALAISTPVISTQATTSPYADTQAQGASIQVPGEPVSIRPEASVPAAAVQADESAGAGQGPVASTPVMSAPSASSQVPGAPGSGGAADQGTLASDSVSSGQAALDGTTPQSGDAASAGTSTWPRPAVREITSADWNPTRDASSEINPSEAPIYSKIRGSAHQPGQAQDTVSMDLSGMSDQSQYPISMDVPASDMPASDMAASDTIASDSVITDLP